MCPGVAAMLKIIRNLEGNWGNHFICNSFPLNIAITQLGYTKESEPLNKIFDFFLKNRNSKIFKIKKYELGK